MNRAFNAARDGVHRVVVVIQVERLLDAEYLGDGFLIAFVGGNGLGVPAGSGHIVVRHADQITGGPLFHQFEKRSRREDRDIV